MPRDWNDVSNENVLSVLLLLDICSRKGKFSLQDAMSQIGYPYAQFSRYRRNPELLAPKFQGVFYNKGVEYLRKTGCLDDAFTPASAQASQAASAFSEFVDQTSKERETAAKRLAGTYAVYRWSHSLRGKYILRGTISIIPGPDGTVDTEEHYSTAEAEDQKEATQFYRSGFFIYRENASLMFSRKSGIRDVQTVHVKKIEFSSTRGGDGKLSWMLGWIVDWENVDLYVTQIAILNIGELPSGFVRAVLPTKEFVEDRALAWLTQASRDDFPNILRF